jgi:hypothetical protein
MSNERPFVVSVTAVLSAVAGLLLFGSGVVLVAGGPGLIYEDAAAVSVGIHYFVGAGTNLVVAAGLWRLWTPIRAFAIGYATVSLVVVIPLILLDAPTPALIAQGIIQAVVLLMFLDSGNRAAFDPISSATRPSQTDNVDMLE